MKKKLKSTKMKSVRIILILLIIVLIISAVGMRVYAGLNLERGTRPRPTNPDTYSPSEPGDVPPITDIVTKNTLGFSGMTSLSGNAFESLEQMREITRRMGDISITTSEFSTSIIKSDTDFPIEGIKVELIDDNDNAKHTTYTDSDGNFKFSDVVKEGEKASYRLRFTYGQYNSDAISGNTAQNVKNSLKYNAQDYGALQVGSSSGMDKSDFIKTTQRITMSNKNEIMVGLDYSASMLEDRRFDEIKEAAINLINELFKNDNTYIGLVMFGPESFLISQPTNIADNLINTIDNFTISDDGNNMCYKGSLIGAYGGTDLSNAVSKIKRSFWSGESNRTILLLTDGIPNLHERVDRLYDDEAENREKVREYFTEIAQFTNRDLKEIENDGINLITVVASELDDEDREMLNITFQDLKEPYIVDSEYIDELLKIAVKGDVTLTDSEAIQDISESETTNWIVGEDEARRARVNEQYKEFKNTPLSNTTNTTYPQMFSLISKLTGNQNEDEKIVDDVLHKSYEDFLSDVEIFTKGNYMTVTTSSSYEFVSYKVDSEDEEKWVVNGQEYYKEEYDEVSDPFIKNDGSYDEQNLVLTARDKIANSIEKKITGLKLTLEDGTVLYDMVSEGAKNTQDCMKNKKKAGIKELSNFPGNMLLQVDRDIIHGATLQIEYTLIFKNDSDSAVTTGFTVLDYYDKAFTYHPNERLLSEDATNSDYKWKIMTGEELINNHYVFPDNTVNINKDQEYIIAKYDESDTDLMNIPIRTQGERYVKLVLSQTLTPEMMQQDYKTLNQAEIVSYSNNLHRRSNYYESTEHLKQLGTETNRYNEEKELIDYIGSKLHNWKDSKIKTTKDVLYAVYSKLPGEYNDFIKNYYTKLVVHDTPGNYKVDEFSSDEPDSAWSISTSITPPTGVK